MLEKEEHGVEFIGPFQPEWRITNDGYRVPYLSAIPQTGPNDGMVLLCLDGRFLIEANEDEMRKWIPFVCHAMAVASGYTHFGPNAKPYHPFGTLNQMMGITSVETEGEKED